MLYLPHLAFKPGAKLVLSPTRVLAGVALVPISVNRS